MAATHNPDEIRGIRAAKGRWQDTTLANAVKKMPERLPDDEFMTVSSTPINTLYTPDDIADLDYARDLGMPGEFPFTRGVHPNLYRSKLWTMRLFAGFGNAQQTNARFKYLLDHGESGLSTAFDFPTLYGRDSDDPMCLGEFGKCGVGVSSIEDMETLYADIPLDKVTVSMTINGPAPVVWAMFIAAAENRGFPRHTLNGTTQNDILKEYIAQNTYIYPPEPSMKLLVDTIEFGTREMPLWNTVSISGYHMREAGATALQEMAFTLINGLTYVQSGIERGIAVDDFAPRLSFFFDSHNDFFEEIAKFRAARRIWARELRDRFGAKNPRSLLLRFHTQTAGVSLTVQQPENNIVRVATQALAAILGGTQSLHTNSMDEALALPTDKAVKTALRTQQILAHETGVTNTVDPLGGSYFVEALTNQMEAGFYDYLRKIEAMGGMLAAINNGFPMREIADASARYQAEVDAKKRIIVGVNEYVEENEAQIPILKIGEDEERQQNARLNRLRMERDNERVQTALEAVRSNALLGHDNMMPYLIEAAKSRATLGEICGVMRVVYGEYKDPAYT